MTARYDYLPFGEQWNPSGSDPLMFAGKEHDSTGFDYFGARYYSSLVGRFTTVDNTLRVDLASAAPQLWNRYAYVRNNPLRRVDPEGQFDVDVHQFLTQVLASVAGFSSSEAATIAVADQYVDQNPATEPLGLSPVGAPKARREAYHFTSEARRDEAWGAFASDPTDIWSLGVFLHLEQDKFSHAGFGPAFGQTAQGAFWDMHRQDRTSWEPERADEMAADTYKWLVKAAGLNGRKPKLTWDQIEKLIRDFNRAGTGGELNEQQNQILGQIEALMK